MREREINRGRDKMEKKFRERERESYRARESTSEAFPGGGPHPIYNYHTGDGKRM